MNCPPLKITFLGTGTSSGIPMIACNCDACQSIDKKDKRLRTSILIQSKNTTIVIDTTPDFRYQMLRANITKLDAILITHPHKDHIAGLDDIRAYNFFQKKAMPVFANLFTQEAIKREFAYIFADDKYPGLPEIQLKTIDIKPFYIGDIPIVPIKVWHYKMPVLAFRFGNFTYITDANKIDAEEKQKIIGSKTVVINALRKQTHLSHYSLDEAVAELQSMQITKGYLIHLSHQMGMHKEISNDLPSNIEIAFDGMEIEVN